MIDRVHELFTRPGSCRASFLEHLIESLAAFVGMERNQFFEEWRSLGSRKIHFDLVDLSMSADREDEHPMIRVKHVAGRGVFRAVFAGGKLQQYGCEDPVVGTDNCGVTD